MGRAACLLGTVERSRQEQRTTDTYSTSARRYVRYLPHTYRPAVTGYYTHHRYIHTHTYTRVCLLFSIACQSVKPHSPTLPLILHTLCCLLHSFSFLGYCPSPWSSVDHTELIDHPLSTLRSPGLPPFYTCWGVNRCLHRLRPQRHCSHGDHGPRSPSHRGAPPGCPQTAPLQAKAKLCCY